MDAAWLGLLSAPAALVADRLLTWLRNRRKDEAQAGLTVDQRWKRYADAQDERIEKLESRMTELEDDLQRERDRAKGLTAEIDRYKSIARSLLRHVIRLREALGQAGAELPQMPPEVEDALTIINLP